MSTPNPGRARPLAAKAVTAAAVLSAGLLLVTNLAQPSAAAPSETKASEVVVANDSTRPVPTQALGTTHVAGTVTANLAGPVTATPAGELVQFEEFIAMAPDGPPVMLSDAYEVPDGKRLVIEHISGAVAMHPEQRVQVRIGQANGLHFLPLRPDPNTESDTFVNRATGSESVTIVVDDTGPDALEVKIQVLREGPRVAVAAPAIVVVTGRLYDL